MRFRSLVSLGPVWIGHDLEGSGVDELLELPVQLGQRERPAVAVACAALPPPHSCGRSCGGLAVGGAVVAVDEGDAGVDVALNVRDCARGAAPLGLCCLADDAGAL